MAGLFTIAVRETVVQQITGQFPLTQRRFDVNWYQEAQCAQTVQATGDLCQGLIIKMNTGVMMEIILAVMLFGSVWALSYFSWLTHQLRWSLLVRTEDHARIGPYGCKLTDDGLAWSWKDWLRDPCASIVIMASTFVFAAPIGLIGWVSGADLLRWRIQLVPQGFQFDPFAFINGVQGRQLMGPGYNSASRPQSLRAAPRAPYCFHTHTTHFTSNPSPVFWLSLVLLMFSIIAGVLAREAYRDIVHSEVDRSMGDATQHTLTKLYSVSTGWTARFTTWVPNLVEGIAGPRKDAAEAKVVANPIAGAHSESFGSSGEEGRKVSPPKAQQSGGGGRAADPSPFESEVGGLPGAREDEEESPFGTNAGRVI